MMELMIAFQNEPLWRFSLLAYRTLRLYDFSWNWLDFRKCKPSDLIILCSIEHQYILGSLDTILISCLYSLRSCLSSSLKEITIGVSIQWFEREILFLIFLLYEVGSELLGFIERVYLFYGSRVTIRTCLRA